MSRLPGFSFCLITNGRRPSHLRATIASIRALALPAYEIIVAGEPSEPLNDVQVLCAPDLARGGHLGAMRNLACRAAQFDHLVVADDDMLFHDDFASGVCAEQEDWDVLCVRLLNPDGTRFWDWATHGGPRGHALLSYDETDDHVYVTGGLAIMRAEVFDRVQWDDVRGFYAGEDLDWSARLRAAGVRIRFSAAATVTHNDPRYTQRDTVVAFRQDLSSTERMADDVVGSGFFRPVTPGQWWMSAEGTLHVPASTEAGRVLHLVLTHSCAPLAHAALPLVFTLNGAHGGQLSLAGGQSCTIDLPLPAAVPLAMRISSLEGFPAHLVGIDDDRLASVLLHDVAVRDGSVRAA
jgi:Glycosyltransferase like family 2